MEPLDTNLRVITPENVSFEYRLAGPFLRFPALLIDLLVMGAILLGASQVLAYFGASGIGLLLFLSFALFWLYGGVLEAMFNGQTIGKHTMNLRVVSGSGLPISVSQALLRNILRPVELFPPAWPGIIACLLDRRFRRLGDLAADTIVVQERRRDPPRLDFALKTAACDELIPATFHADVHLAEALADYVGRRKDLAAARREELARLLARPLLRKWGQPDVPDSDLLLCALYQRSYFDQRKDERERQTGAARRARVSRKAEVPAA